MSLSVVEKSFFSWGSPNMQKKEGKTEAYSKILSKTKEWKKNFRLKP